MIRGALLAVLLLPAGARAIDGVIPPGWTEARHDDNLIVFYKENEGVHAREVRAYTEFDAPPEIVFRQVTDFEAWPQFMPYSKESKIVERSPTEGVLLYQLVSPPFVSDRDYYIRVRLLPGSAANGGVFRSEWTCVNGYAPPRKGVVRMTVNEGSWTYTPIDGGRRTRVLYVLLSHPAGSIPEWLANRSSLSLIPNLFDAVRKRLAESLRSRHD